VGLEGGPLSLITTNEELLERSSNFDLETKIMTIGICHADYATPPLSKKVGTYFADSVLSLSIVRSRTKFTELLVILLG
jgi:hypothetical protein